MCSWASDLFLLNFSFFICKKRYQSFFTCWHQWSCKRSGFTWKRAEPYRWKKGLALAPLRGLGGMKDSGGCLLQVLGFDQVVGLNIEKYRINFYKAWDWFYSGAFSPRCKIQKQIGKLSSSLCNNIFTILPWSHILFFIHLNWTFKGMKKTVE